MGSRTTPYCREPTDALRDADPNRLSSDLARYVTAVEPTLAEDVRDVLVGLAPYYDCAQRLGVDPVPLFDGVASTTGDAMRETMRTFVRRSDVSLEAFGWRLLQAPDGPCYRPDLT
jgi:hypothetical protein